MKKLFNVLLTVAMLFTALTAFAEEAGTTLNLAEIGMFSAGSMVTEPVEGDYDPTQNWMDVNRPGNTAHVDHANVLAEDSKDYKPGDQARRRETEGFAVWRMAPDWLG